MGVLFLDKRDIDDIIRQAKEGKSIAKISEELGIDYWEVYCAAYGAGERSARGVKTMISNRLKKLESVSDSAGKEKLLTEINELVWHLYSRYQDNQQKLDQIRKVIMQ